MKLLRPVPLSLKQFAGRALLFSSVILLEIVLLPSLFSLQVVLGCATFLFLVSRRRERFCQLDAAPALSFARAAVFFLVHLVLLGATWRYLPTPEEALGDASLGGFLSPALKLLILLPGLVLFPLATWSRLARAFSTEAVASLVILLTFYAYRIPLFVWEHLGANTLAVIVDACLTPFFSDAFYRLGDPPIVGTLRFPVSLVYGCLGMASIHRFQTLFGLLVLWDWKRLSPRRALVVYFCGLVTMQAGNLFRIVSFVAIGTMSPEAGIADAYHNSPGWWIFFYLIVSIGFIALTYRWMLGSSQTHPTSLPLSTSTQLASNPLS